MKRPRPIWRCWVSSLAWSWPFTLGQAAYFRRYNGIGAGPRTLMGVNTSMGAPVHSLALLLIEEDRMATVALGVACRAGEMAQDADEQGCAECE
jgi:hypothetical protein